MISLNIVTRCTRVENLKKIKESVDKKNSFNLKWWVLFDTRFNEHIDEDLIKDLISFGAIIKFFYSTPGDMGHSYLNEVFSEIGEGYIYALDDDNILHENFYVELYQILSNTDKKVIVFDQYVGGKDFSGVEVRSCSPENVKVTQIDFAQYVFHQSLTVHKKLRPNEYCADGYFAEELFNENSSIFLFLNKILCYYNFISNLQESL